MGFFNNELTKGVLQGWKEEASKIASSWNGEDKTFLVEGDEYGEETALVATEIVETLEKLETLFTKIDY